MPRTGKGAKPNRTDLNTAAPTGDDREYGSNTADQAAMDAQPVQPQPPAAQPGRMPGDAGALSRPSVRPDEPITSGIARGPGAGPDALATGPSMMQHRSARRAGLYAQALVEKTGDPELMNFLNHVTQRGQR